MPIWIIFIPLASGVLFTLLGIPLQLNKIKPNSLYGFKTKKTLSNEKIWYAANSYAGKIMVVTGAITTILSTVLLILVKTKAVLMNKDSFAMLVLALILVPTLAMTVMSLLKLRKL